MKKYLLSLFMTLFIFTIGSNAFAVEMSVIAGFDGMAFDNNWTPVCVTLKNDEPVDVKGVLKVELPRDTWFRNLYQCDANVELPSNSTKQYHIYFRTSGSIDRVNIKFYNDADAPIEKLCRLKFVANDSINVVSIGERSARPSFLNGEVIKKNTQGSFGAPGMPPMVTGVPSRPPGIPSMTPGTGSAITTQIPITVDSIPYNAMPDRPSAYGGLNFIILNNFSANSANTESLNALAMWVASGGIIIIPAGPNYKQFQNKICDELLPVQITGTASVSLNGIAKLAKTTYSGGATTVSKSILKKGAKLIASESGIPLVVMKKYGAGKIIFLAFDTASPPFNNWNGQTAFWKSLLMQNNGSVIFGDSDIYEDYSPPSGLAEVVSVNPKITAPSINTISIFLAIYLIILVPLNYFILQRKKRLELAWISIPVIVLGFSVVAYAMGFSMKGSAIRLSQIQVVQGSFGNRFAYTISNTALFSPARRNYSISIKDKYALANIISSERSKSQPEAYIGENVQIPDVQFAMWSTKMFESSSGIDMGGSIESDLKIISGNLIGTIKNNTSYDLKDCAIYYETIGIIVGKLQKGQIYKVNKNIPVLIKPKLIKGRYGMVSQPGMAPGMIPGGLPMPSPSPSPYGMAQGSGKSNSEIESVEDRIKSLADSIMINKQVPILVGFSEQNLDNFTIENNKYVNDSAQCFIIKLNPVK